MPAQEWLQFLSNPPTQGGIAAVLVQLDSVWRYDELYERPQSTTTTQSARHVEQILIEYLAKTPGSVQKFGTAPKGTLERKIIDLMKEMGLDRESG